MNLHSASPCIVTNALLVSDNWFIHQRADTFSSPSFDTTVLYFSLRDASCAWALVLFGPCTLLTLVQNMCMLLKIGLIPQLIREDWGLISEDWCLVGEDWGLRLTIGKWGLIGENWHLLREDWPSGPPYYLLCTGWSHQLVVDKTVSVMITNHTCIRY